MRSVFACGLLSFWAFLLPAADTVTHNTAAKKDPPPGVLHSVLVKGNQTYSSAEIVKESGLEVGGRVSARTIDAARTKLESTELFNNVTDRYSFSAASPPAYDVTLEITENPQLFPLRFDRLGVSADAVTRYLREHVPLYSDRIPGTKAVLDRYTAAVQEFVRQSNPSLKVKAAVSNEDPRELAVVFSPDRPAATISQVIVSGNQAVDTGTILRAVNPVAVGVPLSDLRLQQIFEASIKPLYAAKGYAAVTFPKIDTEPAKADLGVIVKVQISEGPQFKFGAIHFHGDGIDQDEIRSTIPFKPGQTFNGDQVENFRVALTGALKRKGFLDAEIKTAAVPDDGKQTVDISYNVLPGEVYNFQQLDIQGLDITTEPVVSKLWGEKPGRPFNPDYPEFFLKRVQQEGIFDNLADAHSDYSADASTHNVTVHLYFKGGKSAADKEKEKKEEEERRKSDGTWSPYPVL